MNDSEKQLSTSKNNTEVKIEIEPLLINAAQTAKILGISVAMYHRLLSSGRIGPARIRLGTKCVRFSVSELRR